MIRLGETGRRKEGANGGDRLALRLGLAATATGTTRPWPAAATTRTVHNYWLALAATGRCPPARHTDT